LIVDDDPAARLLVRHALEGAGFEVEESEDGSDALCTFSEVRPDIVLLDVLMPNMDGFQACEAIRRLQSGAQVPIIMMTGLDDVGSIQHAYDAGATDFITKPFDLTILAQRVKYMLRASANMERLKLNETKQRALLSLIPDVMLRIARDGILLEHEGPDASAFGLCSWCHAGLRLSDVMPPEVASRALWYASRALDTGSVQVFEYQHLTRGDGKRCCEVRIIVCGDDEVLVIIRDVTEQKAHEMALRQNEERYRELFENANDLIQCSGADGEFTYVNKAWRDILGYSDEDLLHLSLFDIVIPECAALCREVFARARAGEKGLNFETVFMAKDSRRIAVEGSLTCRVVEGKTDLTWGIFRNITERKRSEEQIARLAYHDCLTRLPNRVLFRERLSQAIAHAQRDKTMIAVLFLDLDRFKRINDTLGHAMGDEVLQGVADRLMHSLRRSDFVSRADAERQETMVARLGGDEFTILLTDIKNVKAVARVARRIIDDLSKPFVLRRHEVFITTSVGVSLYPYDGVDEDALVRNADLAMYHAKEQGRNNFQFYREGINETAVDRLRIERQIRKGMERDEFVVHYQPRIDLKTDRVVCLEGLIRWNHPERGLIPSSEFISFAEESGLIVPLGELAIRAACGAFRSLESIDPSLRLSVNISPQQLRHHYLTEVVTQAIADSGMSPRSLELELVESAIMGNAKGEVRRLEELRDLGIRLSIDGFGVGHSSLRRLRRLPIDTVKIDRSLVRDVCSDPDAAAITKAIIAMAHSLSLSVVAEGVEQESQLVFLAEHQCDEIQGYLLSPPLGIDSALRFVEKRCGVALQR
jgi:diguanylate cyclase (GGDEF)-like protein/PAS domain S-box-containing protein